MDKSQERALEAYPVLVTKGSVEEGLDWNKEYREVYMQGYEQCEKDIELTWKEVKVLCDCFMDVGLKSNLPAKSKELYEEVLKQFKNSNNHEQD